MKSVRRFRPGPAPNQDDKLSKVERMSLYICIAHLSRLVQMSNRTSHPVIGLLDSIRLINNDAEDQILFHKDVYFVRNLNGGEKNVDGERLYSL